LKPSWGIVSSRGHIPGPPGSLVETDVNCGGPIARDIDDLRTALGVIAGPVPEEAVGWRLELDAGTAVDHVRGLRVATVFHEGADLVPVASDVLTNLDGFAGRLADAGAQVDAVRMPVSLADGLRSWQQLVLPIMGIAMTDDDFASFAGLEAVPGDDPLLEAGRAIASRYRSWAVANGIRQRQRALWAAFFEDYDVALAPVMPTAAFAHDTERPIMERVMDVDGVELSHTLAMAWCGAIGAVLLPVVTVPTGPTPEGLPVGVQVIGPYLSDLRLLALSEALVAAAGPGFTPPPA
jgi:amidase